VLLRAWLLARMTATSAMRMHGRCAAAASLLPLRALMLARMGARTRPEIRGSFLRKMAMTLATGGDDVAAACRARGGDGEEARSGEGRGGGEEDGAAPEEGRRYPRWRRPCPERAAMPAALKAVATAMMRKGPVRMNSGRRH
jgi:hypothetical protein